MNLTSILDPGAEMTQPKYATTHLEFRRDTIEPLPDDAVFEIETPAGTFRMTKQDFHTNFPEIVSSVSYRDLGLYHYPMIPYKAFRFLVREPLANEPKADGLVAAERIDEQPDSPSKNGLEQRIDQVPGE
jgi:hypothetical protein